MATELEDLRVLKAAEAVADEIWKEVAQWDEFPREVVGRQLAGAADSIGANIAESYGRFNYGEKLQFLYYSRGSLFETKYWLNRCLERKLMHPGQVNVYVGRLTDLARQLNAFAASLKTQRSSGKNMKAVRETEASYVISDWLTDSDGLFADNELSWLRSVSNL